jgi:predicted ATPase/transcriptional regulator with XRE-family HTH domain
MGFAWATRSVRSMERVEKAAKSPDFGLLLRRHRIAAGFTQEALAERARMSVRGIASLERGVRRNPQRGTLALLSEALQLSAAELREFELAALPSPGRRRGPPPNGAVWAGSAVATMPFALSSFVGRDREIEEIGALVRDRRMVTLTGAGGVGKTQTALHVASSIIDLDGWNTHFVALAPITRSEQVLSTIASTLGVEEVPARPLLETIIAHIRDGHLLIVLDNCEHVIGEAAITADALLSGCSRMRILATSREPLRTAGEHAYRLAALEVPSLDEAPYLTAEEASGYGSIALFRDRGFAADHRFELTDDNVPSIAEICRRLDGIPLAIELAAARLNQLHVEAIAARLDDRLRVLNQGSRSALPRQQTMRATIDWSYDLLSAPEQRLFERLSIFSGGCTLDMATKICGDDADPRDVFDGLTSLVAKSLLTAYPEGSDTRYVLFESFREYAAAKLADRGEADSIALRHALAYHELSRRTAPDFLAFPDALSNERVEQERDNWRAALSWTLVERGDISLGQQIAARSCGIWFFMPLEGRRWINLAAELADARTPAGTMADLDFAKAVIAWYNREYVTQLAASNSATAHFRSVGDRSGIARGQTLAGHALVSLGRAAEAETPLLEALTLAREAAYPNLLPFVLRCLALASSYNHDIAAARTYTAEVLSIYNAAATAIGNNERICRTIADLAQFECYAGNLELALTVANEVIARPLDRLFVRTTCSAMNTASMCLSQLGRYDEAEEHARRALDLERDARVHIMAAWTLQHLAAIVAFRPQSDTERLRDAHSRAATILGFVDAYLLAVSSQRSPEEIPEYDRLLQALRSTLSSDALTALMASGAALNEDRAVELAVGASP